MKVHALFSVGSFFWMIQAFGCKAKHTTADPLAEILSFTLPKCNVNVLQPD